MMQSLLIKVAMLAVTLGSLVWIASVTPVTKVMPGQPQLLPKHPVSTVASAPPTNVPTTKPALASANQTGMLPRRPVVMPIEESESPRISEKTSPESPPAYQAGARQVDLNQATLSDLEALPGIGPKLAQRVIEHRDEKGPFRSVDDLRQVKGIGRKKFDRLRPHVLVTNTKSPARHKGTL
jgi:competence protein ComEA